MKRIVLMSIFLISGLVVFAHNKEKGSINLPSTKPDVHYKVNKTYDSHGNLIGYDSTYSYRVGGKEAVVKADSLFKHMNGMGGMMPGMQAAFPNISDSAMVSDFFNQPGFAAGWQSAMKQMRMEMQQMESMDQAFMQHAAKGHKMKKRKAGISQ
ncbi:MAG: hypothetical protein JXR71_11010 [Bacteroidales bacterium]|nr:hypothetical protein [Bacteroidales bacterium]